MSLKLEILLKGIFKMERSCCLIDNHRCIESRSWHSSKRKRKRKVRELLENAVRYHNSELFFVQGEHLKVEHNPI